MQSDDIEELTLAEVEERLATLRARERDSEEVCEQLLEASELIGRVRRQSFVDESTAAKLSLIRALLMRVRRRDCNVVPATRRERDRLRRRQRQLEQVETEDDHA